MHVLRALTAPRITRGVTVSGLPRVAVGRALARRLVVSPGRRGLRLPDSGVQQLPWLSAEGGRPSQRNASSAKVMAGETGWEVARLGRMSSLLLRGRALSGWWCYTDLSKYRWAAKIRQG